ncbi:MAG: hypothetical protein HY290_21545 [Planctomycetia bacterium]|nr:hypothetical protein [Planctomycetia bacterium]
MAAVALAADKKASSKKNEPAGPADDTAIGEQLKEAFDAGFVIGPRRAQEAAKHFVQARRLAPHEPRIDYAHGLVLAKQSQVRQAVTQFEAAIKHEGKPSWPAWKAAVWAHLVEKQYEPGLKRLDEFARLVHDAESAGDAAETRREAARWIGQILESLAVLPDAKKHKETVAEHQTAVLDALGDELAVSVEEGRELLRARAVELGLAADAARDTAEQIARRRKQDQSEKLEKDLEGVSKEMENAAKSKEDWKKWVDDTLAKFDKQLGQLDRDYQALQRRANDLEQAYVQAGTRLTAVNANLGLLNPRTTDPQTMANLREQSLQFQNQMLAYQVEYNVNLERISNLAQQAAGVAEQRAGAIARYEKETGDLIKKNADLDKWSARLKDKKQKLVTKPGSKGGKKDAPEKKQPPSLKSLMPLDLERERDEVLASFGVKPTAPTAPPAVEKPVTEKSAPSEN